ncbi:MAG: hypothetical protein IPM26_12840 [Saprospiraceae bacterium]|nr:hypothetical protein [Saprospiraceae bacterium]
MKAKRYLFCIFFTVILFTLSISAQVSPRVRISSNLKDANGAAVKDGTYNITFRLYNEESGGTPVWTEQASVTVRGGMYSHLLGSMVPLSGVNFKYKVFLGTQVGDFEMSPRTELSYAPYAVAAVDVICSGAVGDVKYSILNPTLFAQVNGDCWVPLNGGDMTDSRLSNITGQTNVPDISGLFIRSQEFSGGANRDPDRSSSSAIATFQDQSYQSHNHGLNDPGHSHPINDKVRLLSGNNFNIAGGSKLIFSPNQYLTENRIINPSTTGISVNNFGGAETRPKNLNVWMYIRIN